LPAIGAALIETAKRAADCREIGRNRGPRAPGEVRDPRAFAAPGKRRPDQRQTDFPPLAGLPQRSDLALLLLGNERPMVAGSIRGDQKTSISGLRFQDFDLKASI
jgi:hypothetical protein